MAAADIVVIAAAALILAGLGWFFFGPRRPRSAQLDGGVQRAVVTVRGGDSPGGIRVGQGVPGQLTLYRQGAGGCTPPGVFSAFSGGRPVRAFLRAPVWVGPRH